MVTKREKTLLEATLCVNVAADEVDGEQAEDTEEYAPLDDVALPGVPEVITVVIPLNDAHVCDFDGEGANARVEPLTIIDRVGRVANLVECKVLQLR